MDEQGHEELISHVADLKGLAVIRHSPSDLYDDLAREAFIYTKAFVNTHTALMKHGEEMGIDQLWFKMC